MLFVVSYTFKDAHEWSWDKGACFPFLFKEQKRSIPYRYSNESLIKKNINQKN